VTSNFRQKYFYFHFSLNLHYVFRNKISKKSPSCEKKIPKEINNNNLGLIQLFISKISPNYVAFGFTMEMKVKYINLSSLEEMILEICCNIFFKVVELIICVNV